MPNTCQHTCRRFCAASKIKPESAPADPILRRHFDATPLFESATLQLSGTVTALATPFTDAGDIDFPAWQRLLEAQLTAGTHAVVVAGSTGEAAALSDAEFETLLSATLAFVAGRIPVLAGTGQSNTAKTIQANQRAAALGADAALVVTPPYVRPTQSGLLAHFRAVADQGGLPVVLYNVPGRTGCDMAPETTAELAMHPNIVGIKEAVADAARMDSLLPLRRKGFAVLSGDDPTALRAMLAGADGIVSVASNVVPGAFRHLCELARAGDAAEAEAFDAYLHALYHFLSLEPNPIPLKALLALNGTGHGLRLPLQPLSSVHAAEAKRLHADIIQLEQRCRLNTA